MKALIALPLLMMMTGFASGCASGGSEDGVVLMADTRIPYVTNARASLVEAPLEPRTPTQPNLLSTAEHWARVKVKFNWNGAANTYDALLHPQSSGAFDEPDAGFYLQAGWVIVTGQHPMIRTSRLSASADGSALIVQIETTAAGDRIERVYFVSGTSAWVHVGSGSPEPFPGIDYVYELPPTGLGTFKPIVDPSLAAFRTIADKIKTRALAAGIPI